MSELSLHEQLLNVFMGQGHTPEGNAAVNEIHALRARVAELEAQVKKPAAKPAEKPTAPKKPAAPKAKK